MPKLDIRKKSSDAVLRNRPLLLIGDSWILKLTILTLYSTNIHTFRAALTKIRTTNKFYRIAFCTMGQNYDFLAEIFFYQKWFFIAGFDENKLFLTFFAKFQLFYAQKSIQMFIFQLFFNLVSFFSNFRNKIDFCCQILQNMLKIIDFNRIQQ
jgi:hypothetical protein